LAASLKLISLYLYEKCDIISCSVPLTLSDATYTLLASEGEKRRHLCRKRASLKLEIRNSNSTCSIILCICLLEAISHREMSWHCEMKNLEMKRKKRSSALLRRASVRRLRI